MSSLLRSSTIIYLVLLVILFISGCDPDKRTCAHRIDNQDDAIKFSIQHWNEMAGNDNFKFDEKDALILTVRNPDFLNPTSKNRLISKDTSIYGVIWTIDFTYNTGQKYYFIKTKFNSCGVLDEETYFIHGDQ